jgi:hypothetical protein
MTVNDAVQTLQNWERSGGTVRIIGLSDTEAVVDLCACTGERMDSLASSDRELIVYLGAQAAAAEWQWSPGVPRGSTHSSLERLSSSDAKATLSDGKVAD